MCRVSHVCTVAEFNGVPLQKDGYRATDAGEWHTISAIVIGTGGDDKVAFKEATTKSANDGSGPFLDNIVMLPVPDQPIVDDDVVLDDDTRSGTKPTADCGIAGNLVENCSFEANMIPDYKFKMVDPTLVPAWESYSGEKLELWGDLMGRVPAPHGKVCVQEDISLVGLDSHTVVCRPRIELFGIGCPRKHQAGRCLAIHSNQKGTRL